MKDKSLTIDNKLLEHMVIKQFLMEDGSLWFDSGYTTVFSEEEFKKYLLKLKELLNR